MTSEKREAPGGLDFGRFFGKHGGKRKESDDDSVGNKHEKWSMGVLNDKYTIEVPGEPRFTFPPCAFPSLFVPRIYN